MSVTEYALVVAGTFVVGWVVGFAHGQSEAAMAAEAQVQEQLQVEREQPVRSLLSPEQREGSKVR